MEFSGVPKDEEKKSGNSLQPENLQEAHMHLEKPLDDSFCPSENDSNLLTSNSASPSHLSKVEFLQSETASNEIEKPISTTESHQFTSSSLQEAQDDKKEEDVANVLDPVSDERIDSVEVSKHPDSEPQINEKMHDDSKNTPNENVREEVDAMLEDAKTLLSIQGENSVCKPLTHETDDCKKINMALDDLKTESNLTLETKQSVKSTKDHISESAGTNGTETQEMDSEMPTLTLKDLPGKQTPPAAANDEELSSDSSVPNSPVQRRTDLQPDTPSSIGESPMRSEMINSQKQQKSEVFEVERSHPPHTAYSSDDDGETQLLDKGEVRIPPKEKSPNHSLQPKDEFIEEKSSVPAPVPHPPEPAPCMKGDLLIEEGHHVCKGFWGMTREAHDAGDVSLFEYRSNQPADIGVFPHCGFYKGHFMVKQPAPRHPLKVEEKALFLKFIQNTEGTYNLEGNGSNRYGVYTMTGILQPNGFIEFYRTYQSIKVPARGRKTPSRQRPKKQPASKKKPSVKIISDTKLPSQLTLTQPREIGTPYTPGQHIDSQLPKRTPRSSRGSWKDIAGYDDQENKKSRGLKRKLSTLRTNEHTPRGRVGRPKQPNSFIDEAEASDIELKFTKDVQRQLSEFMNFMMTRKNSFWFNEPVDPEVLNIPDYFDIISKPMDFGTVSSKLKAGMYKRIEDVAADVRLTLKNALAYNIQKDNPVNIAAKDLSKVFEERYRKLRDKLIAAEISKRGRQRSRKSKVPGVGPRPVPPEDHGVDVVPSSYLVKMQRQMMQMQQTIMALQKAQTGEISTPQKSESPVAMTFQEKRALSENINKLAPEKLTRVVQIIQESIPLEDRTEDDEIEIDIDSLDQVTLRRLEVYVKQSLRRRRGPRGGKSRDYGMENSGSSDGGQGYDDDNF